MMLSRTMYLGIFLLASWLNCLAQDVYEVCSGLHIEQVTDHTYRHIVDLTLGDGSKVSCNGMVIVKSGEAIVFDTPVYDSLCYALIDWLEQDKQVRITAVVINHHHIDCTGGLEVFHAHGIPTYALEGGCVHSEKQGNPCAMYEFSDSLSLEAGGMKVWNVHFGHAHAPDNIVSYIPDEQVLFGGCAVKALGAGRGNLSDADIEEWPLVIKRMQNRWPEIMHVIPGHGNVGGPELLSYTIRMFKQDE